jgi:hypothetical protein
LHCGSNRLSKYRQREREREEREREKERERERERNREREKETGCTADCFFHVCCRRKGMMTSRP